MIHDLKKSNEWKKKLIMRINFMSSEDIGEKRPMHSKSDNRKIMTGFDTNKIIAKLIDSFLQRQQEHLENLTKSSESEFDFVDKLHCKCHKVSLKRVGSCIDSPKWLKDKHPAINPKNNDNTCFKYNVMVALNRKSIGKHPERIPKITPFIDRYD